MVPCSTRTYLFRSSPLPEIKLRPSRLLAQELLEEHLYDGKRVDLDRRESDLARRRKAVHHSHKKKTMRARKGGRLKLRLRGRPHVLNTQLKTLIYSTRHNLRHALFRARLEFLFLDVGQGVPYTNIL